MGIKGIYKEIGPGERVALSKLAVEKFEQTGRPLRIAIDMSIWLFQIQSSKGGTNPALRTFYYRLLRLLSLSIHPLFVFDGPNKPPFKRNKKTGHNVVSIPEFLAKQLLRQFGFPQHCAPGEAEAECALLQREGIVDAVLSEDVDTLMFGSIISLRSWTPQRKGGPVTHVNLYDAQKTKAGPAGLDREGMILVALMSGGDYIPEGIEGCGPKIACEAARAGFGHKLCKIQRKDTAAIQAWKEDLAHELRTNESKFFKRKHAALTIPDDFPRMDILRYYTHPAISSADGLAKLRSTLRWDQDLNFTELRSFAADAFDWRNIGGAKKFVRNLAPALLVRQLRMRGQRDPSSLSTSEEVTQAEEARLVTSIHGKRQHPSTDNTTEIRIAFKPIEIVNIDLDAEEPDDELQPDIDEEDEDAGAADEDAPKRGPSTYDPTELAREWILETYAKAGVPLTVEDWEEGQRTKDAKKRPAASKATKPRKQAAKASASGGMQVGALDRFAKVTKAGTSISQVATKETAKSREPSARAESIEQIDMRSAPSSKPRSARTSSSKTPELANIRPATPPPVSHQVDCIDLSSSPAGPREVQPKTATATADEHYLSPNVTKRRKQFRRTKTAPVGLTEDETLAPSVETTVCAPVTDAGDLLSSPIPEISAIATTQPLRGINPFRDAASKGAKTPPRRRARQPTADRETASPSRRQMTLLESFERGKSATPKKPRYKSTLDTITGVEQFDLTGSSPLTVAPPPARNPPAKNAGDPPPADESTTHRARNRAKASKATAPSRTALLDSSGNARSRGQSPQPPALTTPKPTDPSPGPGISTSAVPSTTQLSPNKHNLVPLRRSPRQKKQVVKLRESLVGSWKVVDVEEVDMTGDAGGVAGGKGGAAKGKGRSWRASEVELLDMTEG